MPRHMRVAGCIHSDFTGSVDHTHCCMAHAACLRWSTHLYERGAFEPVENDLSGNVNGLELSERPEKHQFFPSERNKKQTRHVLIGTINFHLMLLATRNLVELVRSCPRLGGVSDTPVEGPFSFDGG